MATCKDCIHEEICDMPIITDGRKNASNCNKFKNKADFVEVKKGKWIAKENVRISKRGRLIHYHTFKCSVCGKWNGRHNTEFCPKCGAKMDGKNDNDLEE